MTRAVLAVAFALLACPAAAAAQITVAVSGDQIVVTGGAEDSRLSVAERVGVADGAREYAVGDQSQPVAPGEGCRQDGDQRNATCALPGGAAPARIRAELGAGHDLIRHDAFSDVPVLFFGGEGTDYLIGGAGADRLDGGPGIDYLAGDEGLGQPGARRRRGDDFVGGPDLDQVVYEGHGEAKIVVSLDNAPDDGGLGEGDNVHSDIESVRGDSAAENELEGGPGPDILIGGNRNDSLIGRGGVDQLLGGGGDDGILARDGEADRVDCGDGGADRANVDEVDTGLGGCEDVFPRFAPQPAPPADPAPPVVPPAQAFQVTIPTAEVRLSTTGLVILELACGASSVSDCAGRLRVASTKRVRIGKRRGILGVGEKAFRIPAGATARIAFRLSATERRALRRAKRIGLTASAVEAAAQPRTVERTLTLRRR